MGHTNAFDLVTVGHVAIDTILSPRIMQSRFTLGGSPTYVSVAAAKLNARVSIISKAGADFPDEYFAWLQNNHVDLSGLKCVSNASTTRFILKYRNWQRKLRLVARAPPIQSTDIPSSLSSAIVHVAPIADEISCGVVAKLRKSARILSLDPQGFLRSFDEKGNVVLKEWQDPEVLAQVDIFKSTARELQAVTGIRDLKSSMKKLSDYGIRIVVVTKGIRGSTLFFDKQFYDIPAFESQTILDLTGAGDAYIGGFLAEYVRGRDALWCGRVGSATASFVVEGVGPERFGERHEVYERAQEIYEKVVGKKR